METTEANLFLYQTFDSIETARRTVREVMVAQNLSYKVISSNQDRLLAACRSQADTGCEFSIRIAYQERSGKYELRKLVPHSCNFSTHADWKGSNSAELIAERHDDMIKSDSSLKPKQIQHAERLQNSNQVPYLQAWRAKKRIERSTSMNREQAYQLIQPFLESITDAGLDSEIESQGSDQNWAMSRANAVIARDADNGFDWCFLAPRACIHAFWQCRRFVCLDGAHMKSEKGLILLIATTLDANEEILPLMWGFTRNESKESWLEFLYNFRAFFLGQVEPSEEERQGFETLTIISDRGKGLAPATAEVFPQAFHYHCTQHLAENVGGEHGKKIEKLFRDAAQVETNGQFESILDKIESLSASARHYIDQIDKKHYARSHAPLTDFPRYGQTCSNISESMNSAWMVR